LEQNTSITIHRLGRTFRKGLRGKRLTDDAAATSPWPSGWGRSPIEKGTHLTEPRVIQGAQKGLGHAEVMPTDSLTN